MYIVNSSCISVHPLYKYINSALGSYPTRFNNDNIYFWYVVSHFHRIGVPINHALSSCVLSPDLNYFIMQKFSTNHTKLLTTMTSVYHNLAMLVTGSKDKTVEMFAMRE